MSFLGSLFGGNDIEKANKQAQAALGKGKTEGLGYLDTALNSALPYLQQGTALYQPYTQTGGQANTAYANALGLNGAAGNASATAAFQSAPGYQFQLNQGLDALDRRASAHGMLNSGNTNADTINYAQGVANQGYGDYLSRLQGLGSQGLQATQGQAAGLGSISNLYQGIGNNKSNVTTGVASQQANAFQNAGQQQAAATANGWGALLGGVTGLASGNLFGGGGTTFGKNFIAPWG